MPTIAQLLPTSAPGRTVQERVEEFMREACGVRIRLRRQMVCGAMRAFGVIEKDEEFDKFVREGLMSAMPPVNGKRRKSYHRDVVLRFIVQHCRESAVG